MMAIVSFIYSSFLLVLLIWMLLKWRAVGGAPFLLLSAIIFLSLLLELLTSFVFSYLSNNLFFYHLFNPVECILYGAFFRNLKMSAVINKIVLMVTWIFIVFAITMSLFIQKIDENNSYVVIAESIVLIAYCLVYLWHINVNELERRAEKNPFFWMVCGILVYFTGSLFLEGFLGQLMDSSITLAASYNRLSFLFKYLYCILIAIGIAKTRTH